MCLQNSYAGLGDAFAPPSRPRPASAPRLIRLNEPLAEALGLDPGARERDAWAAIFAGNALLPGSDPRALAYAGHQFGRFVPELGDGRAVLLGELVDGDGVVHDIHLKGAGRTPFSGGGDGRAALGPVLREYVVSEAIHAFGIPTTRALAAVTTGDSVLREGPLPGGVLARVARSHIRVGTFEYFAARGDTERVRTLAAYAMRRHDPDLWDNGASYADWLRAVSERQARLVAAWLGVGFVHGVMNTDNVSIAGETIDYGPCAFMEAYDPQTVFSSIDRGGRYAYGEQAGIAQWNLARFAETLLPLLDADRYRAVEVANEIVAAFGERFEAHWLAVMRRKLGLASAREGDRALVDRLLAAMRAAGADWTRTFRQLAGATTPETTPPRLVEIFGDTGQRDGSLAAWRERLAAEGTGPSEASARMRACNPAVIPRNHRVERMIREAVERGDLEPFHRLVELFADPFAREAESAPEALPAAPEERVTRTFCGT